MNDHDGVASPVPPEQGGAPTEELAYRLRQQQLTAEFGRFALRTCDLATLLQEATRMCALGLQSEFCKIMEFLPDERQFVVRAGVGWKAGVVGHARSGADTESPAGYAFQTGKPVVSNHLAAETRFRTPAILVEHGVKRAVNVLIHGDQERFGVLEVDSPTPGRFTEADIAFMQGLANLLGIAVERQRAEDALRASEARARSNATLLEQTLEHQEVLTREVSHRVKNSLTIVASLLKMQARTSSHPEVGRALADAESRVQTIARVHDRLWRAHEVNSLDLADFIGELAEQLRLAAPPGVTLSCDAVPATLNTDQAVSLGLLINELVTNAFKYAYPGGAGKVRISITSEEEGHFRLTICDEGTGLPVSPPTAQSTSLGMRLINSLAGQIGGKPQWQDVNPGTRFALDFTAQGGREH
jgi:two-component sensor histidine kinase